MEGNNEHLNRVVSESFDPRQHVLLELLVGSNSSLRRRDTDWGEEKEDTVRSATEKLELEERGRKRTNCEPRKS